MGRNEGIQALSWLLLQTCVIRAWDLSKPLLFCPAMNTAMWEHPITARQVEQLKGFGYTEIPCVVKKLVCGDEGQSFPVAPAPSPPPVLPSSWRDVLPFAVWPWRCRTATVCTNKLKLCPALSHFINF